MKKRILSGILALCMVITLLPATAQAASADNMVAIAKAEVGTSGSPNKYTRWNGTINGSYDYWWCAAFVSWVANQAGESAAIPKTASVYVMANGILNAGGKRVTSPQAGDIVVYRRIADNYYAHVGIMESSTTSIEGNYGNAVCRGIRPSTYSDGAGSTVSNGKIEIIYLRPNYKNAASGTSTKVTVQSYFNCDVQINTTKGKTVNLYNSPTDSTRKTYFDQGQTAYSTYGAKLSDGSTWYRIQAIDNGNVVTLWLNAASSGVTIIDRKVDPSLSFSPGSLSLDLGASKTVSITFKGDGIYNLSYGIGDNSVCSASWGSVDYTTGKTSLTVTGKSGGSTKIAIYLNDKNGNSLYSQSINVSVTAPTYTVSYNANGGSGAPSSQTKTYGKNLTLSSQKPTRSGYTFKGWATSSNSSSGSYQPGGTYSGNSSLTLYAVWVPSAPTVKEYFNCNVQINTTKGKTVNLYNSPTDSTRKTYFDQGQTAYSTYGAKLSDGSTWYRIQAVDNGKVVTLWLNAASSGVTIIDKTVAPSLSFSPSSLSLDLGASKTVSITFKGDGIYNLSCGIGDSGVCSASWGSVDYTTGKTSLTVTGKAGGSTKITIYLNDKNGNSLYSQSINVSVTAPTYTVSYNANGGSGAPSSQTKQHDKTLTLSSVKPTRDGYTFKGWATSSGASSAQYQPGGSYTSNKNLTLYAVWMPKSVQQVTYRINHYKETLDGKYELADTDTLTGTAGEHINPMPRYYVGFVTPAEQSGTVPNVNDNVVINYYYVRQSYKINLTAGNGIDSVSGTGAYHYGETVNISAKVLDGYEWDAWYGSPSVSGLNSRSMANSFAMPATNVTLTAMAVKPDHQHNLSYNYGVSSSCKEGGTQEYWSCAGCGKWFADSSASKEITDIYLDPLGHNYVDGICTRCGAADPNAAPSATEVHLPRQTIYIQDQFTDVYENQWFTKNVIEAYELGLMVGTSDNTFSPYGDVTLAQAITMACRIHSIYKDGYENIPKSDGAWYQSYLDYAYRNGIISLAYYNAGVENKATRAQFAQIMANALPDEGFYAMNSVANDSIPDVPMSESFSSAVYKLYRAGILSGGDVNGTFFPKTYITRAEAAAVVSRIAESSNRVSFSLS